MEQIAILSVIENAVPCHKFFTGRSSLLTRYVENISLSYIDPIYPELLLLFLSLAKITQLSNGGRVRRSPQNFRLTKS